MSIKLVEKNVAIKIGTASASPPARIKGPDSDKEAPRTPSGGGVPGKEGGGTKAELRKLRFSKECCLYNKNCKIGVNFI